VKINLKQWWSTVMVNNSTNINKMNNQPSPQTIKVKRPRHLVIFSLFVCIFLALTILAIKHLLYGTKRRGLHKEEGFGPIKLVYPSHFYWNVYKSERWAVIVFGFTRPVLEPTICYIREEHAIHYTTCTIF
jgi:hypothetical protein